MTEDRDATAPGTQKPDFWAVSEPGIQLFMNATLTIKPERLEEYLAALREVLPSARAEPTNIYLHVGQSMTESGVFVLSEGWRDLVEYRDVIRQKLYFQAYLQLSEGAYAQPRIVVPLSPIEP